MSLSPLNVSLPLLQNIPTPPQVFLSFPPDTGAPAGLALGSVADVWQSLFLSGSGAEEQFGQG
jgi:hypothetical protein